MKKTFFPVLCALLLASCSLSTPTTPSDDYATAAPAVKLETTPSDKTTNQSAPTITAKDQSPKTTPVVPQKTTPVTKTYSSTEVAQHSTASDCWLILDNGVYDVTSFIPRHPGGDKILRGCGKDATQMFAQHPESAKALKEQFKIGDLAK